MQNPSDTPKVSETSEKTFEEVQSDFYRQHTFKVKGPNRRQTQAYLNLLADLRKPDRS